MEKAVDVAEKNAARFRLSQAEISSRRKWVMQTRRQVGGSALMTCKPWVLGQTLSRVLSHAK
jgi:hypothetical protein